MHFEDLDLNFLFGTCTAWWILYPVNAISRELKRLKIWRSTSWDTRSAERTLQASSYASAVVVILSVGVSVCLSVCPSLACFVIKPNNALQIFWYRTKGQSLCFLLTTMAGGRRSLPWNFCSKWPTPSEKHRLRQISGYNVSNVTGSEKRSIMANSKSTTGFPTGYTPPISRYISKNGAR